MGRAGGVAGWSGRVEWLGGVGRPCIQGSRELWRHREDKTRYGVVLSSRRLLGAARRGAFRSEGIEDGAAGYRVDIRQGEGMGEGSGAREVGRGHGRGKRDDGAREMARCR
ncbi:hypothetical protein GCM10027456_15260 [Kineosporia babensis]